MRKLLLIITLLSLLLLSSCAYYNTFYNAKKQFNVAEKAYYQNPPEVEISSSQRELYEQAIKKASKILAFFPNSKYVDDALFLMGKAYFRMEEFGKSQRKFEELLANYPQSKFRFEAGYLLGTIHYYMDDQTKAKDVLMAIIESPKKSSWADNARHTLGEMAYWKGDYQVAVEEYTRLIEDYPNSELRAESVFMSGECYFKLEKYQKALEAYEQAKRYEFSTAKRYQLELRIGECYRKLNQYAQALDTFEKLARSDRYVDHLPEIQLRISEAHYLMGDTAQAIGDYEEIARQNEKTKEAAWAYYQLGLIFMEGMSDFEKAKGYFDKSKAASPTSEAAQLATLKQNQINKLEEYRNRVSSADSLQLAEAYFALAEVYLLDLNRPDSALVYYRQVLTSNPQSKYAPQSSYVIAWITENSPGDTATSRKMYRELIDTYPLSESANVARRRLGQPALQDTSEQDAAQRFRRAEELLLKESDVEGALAQYQSILTDFPLTPYAPKAECAIAWTLEYLKGDRDSAMVIFARLVKEHPESECALLAKKKITPPPAPAAPDTSRQASADTTGQDSVIGQPTEEEGAEEEGAQDDEEKPEQSRSRRRSIKDDSAEGQ